MIQNPTSNLNVLENTFAEIRFKQLYFSNHSVLDTFTYELSFPQRPILSPPTILNFPPVHPVFISIVQKGIVPIIRLLQQSTLFMFANSYHSSHNVIFTLLMNIMDQLNYIKPSKFSDSECF